MQSRSVWACALAAAVAISAAGFSAATAEPLKIRTSWQVTPAQLAPILFEPGVAVHNGKSYTLEATRSATTGSGISAFLAGEVDIMPMLFTYFTPIVQNAGVTDVRIIADEIRDGMPGYDTNLYLVHKDSPIQKVEDLKGKVIAINGVGGGQDVFMRVMLRKHGLEANRDYTLIEVPLPTMRAILAEKKADMVVGVKPFTEDPNFRNVYRVLFTQREAVGATDTIFWASRTGFLEKNRPAVVDYLEDVLRVTRWYTDPANHDKAVEIVSRVTKIPAPQLGWIFTKNDFYRDPNLVPDLESIQRSVDVLREFGFMKADVKVNQFSDLSLIQEAAARLNK